VPISAALRQGRHTKAAAQRVVGNVWKIFCFKVRARAGVSENTFLVKRIFEQVYYSRSDYRAVATTSIAVPDLHGGIGRPMYFNIYKFQHA